MISHFTKSINKFNDKTSKCSQNIEEIRSISSLLEVSTIEQIDLNNNSFDILNDILFYEETYIINDYSNFNCPCCKNTATLSFHKLYSRNFIFSVGSYLITTKIKLVVLECSHCKQNKEKQQFHTLIPDFIFPYHAHSSNIILDCITEKNKQTKIEDITNKYNISHQLLYYWIYIFIKYLLVCSIILKIANVLSDVINSINENRKDFLKLFYQKYFHPFFLNKKTCVPLAITP